MGISVSPLDKIPPEEQLINYPTNNDKVDIVLIKQVIFTLALVNFFTLIFTISLLSLSNPTSKLDVHRPRGYTYDTFIIHLLGSSLLLITCSSIVQISVVIQLFLSILALLVFVCLISVLDLVSFTNISIWI